MRRLDLLLNEATEQLKAADPSNDRVSEIVRAHHSDVIRPESVRPVVERPLGPMDVAQPPQRFMGAPESKRLRPARRNRRGPCIQAYWLTFSNL